MAQIWFLFHENDDGRDHEHEFLHHGYDDDGDDRGHGHGDDGWKLHY